MKISYQKLTKSTLYVLTPVHTYNLDTYLFRYILTQSFDVKDQKKSLKSNRYISLPATMVRSNRRASTGTPTPQAIPSIRPLWGTTSVYSVMLNLGKELQGLSVTWFAWCAGSLGSTPYHAQLLLLLL